MGATRLLPATGSAKPSMEWDIPFNRPTLTGNELTYIAEAIRSNHIGGDGPFTKRVQSWLEEQLGVYRVLLTPSCTHALEIAALLLEIQPGDEVIVPAYTFVSTVNAFVLRGARPVFVDIRSDTLNLNEARLEEAITPRTRAIIAVHYAGVACEMEAILQIASKHGVAVVEDNAHGLFGRYQGKHLGALGCLAGLSFHETKNFSCGEGGALLINDARYAERAEVIREKGTDRARFLRGEVEQYTWVDLGSSYLISDVSAAFLHAQLEERQAIQSKRHLVWDEYYEALGGWARENAVSLPAVPAHCEQPFHMFYLLMPSLDSRQRLMAHLRSCGIQACFHYQPLHLSPMGRSFGGCEGLCPVSEAVSQRLLRLPFYTGLTKEDQARVVKSLLAFRV